MVIKTTNVVERGDCQDRSWQHDVVGQHEAAVLQWSDAYWWGLAMQVDVVQGAVRAGCLSTQLLID
jgi:hypothetical protein